MFLLWSFLFSQGHQGQPKPHSHRRREDIVLSDPFGESNTRLRALRVGRVKLVDEGECNTDGPLQFFIPGLQRPQRLILGQPAHLQLEIKLCEGGFGGQSRICFEHPHPLVHEAGLN